MNITPELAARIARDENGDIIQQGTKAWFYSRCGNVTASGVIHALAIAKVGKRMGSSTEGRKTYMASKIAELLTGEPDMDGYVTDAMNRGSNEEDGAIAAYEIAEDVDVDRVGFVKHPTIERAGSSPDGLVGADGLVEVKNPKSKNHIAYMLDEVLPDIYEPQVMFQLDTCEREWCDFISRDGRFPKGLQVFCKRIYRNETRIMEIRAGVLQFWEEADEIIYRLQKRYGAIPDVAPKPESKPVRKPKVDQPIDPSLGITDDDMPDWYKAMTK